MYKFLFGKSILSMLRLTGKKLPSNVGNTKFRQYLCFVFYMEWFLTQYCAGGKIEKNEMGGACGAYGGGERCAQGSGGVTGGKVTTGETQT